MDIHLKFYNYSGDAHLHDVIFFQNNTATDFEEITTAWKVIRHCAYGNYHPFIYSAESFISASDSYGNFTPQLPAFPGQSFHVSEHASGNLLSYKKPAESVLDMEMLNDLERGAIGANIFKAGRLYARKTSIAPGQKAVFRFKPTLFVTVGSGIAEGAGIQSAVISAHATELSLVGVASADIIMTGGGPGSESLPFSFHMDNIAWA